MRRLTAFTTLLLSAGLALIIDNAYAAPIPANIAQAVSDSNRPETDTKRDANRKPGETLTFVGITSGEKIAELLPGAGYFTRILSKSVGPRGKVFTIVPPRPANSTAEQPDMATRIKAVADDPSYANVTVLQQPLAPLTVPEPVDVVFTAQNYHDLHNIPGLDIAAFNKSVYASLKPGGIYVVVDHSAEAGSQLRDTSTLHRIDQDTVKKEVLAAGFKLAGSSDILANAADPRTSKIFDPSIRGTTDQFILKFRKPKK
jgi:predicted methyltransferase